MFCFNMYNIKYMHRVRFDFLPDFQSVDRPSNILVLFHFDMRLYKISSEILDVIS